MDSAFTDRVTSRITPAWLMGSSKAARREVAAVDVCTCVGRASLVPSRLAVATEARC